MSRFLVAVLGTWVLVSCSPESRTQNGETAKQESVGVPVLQSSATVPLHPVCLSVPEDSSDLEGKLRIMGLVDVQELDSSFHVDLKYAGTDNFMGFPVYRHLHHAFLQADAAGRLVKAQRLLKKRFPFYSILIFDAVRPLHIQKLMWDTLKMPPGWKQQYLSSPALGSLHNYGVAVDVSIVNADGQELDMGTKFDFFGALAHPEFEDKFVREGKLSHRQMLNRELLREVMQAGGFSRIETEWWHFNCCSRTECARLYKIVE
jgi:D-alanyl-D-alanine dipeptidase